MIDELLEAFQQATRKARKEHRCCECRGVIRVGECYEYSSGISCDGPESFKTCSVCAEIRKEAFAEATDMYDGPAFTMLHEYVWEGENDGWKIRYYENKVKRGAKSEPWMTEQYEEAKERPS